MRLIILRHGKAQEHALSMKDRDRKLADRGIEKIKNQTELIASYLKDTSSVKIISSPAARCAQTAKLVAEGLGINTDEIDYFEEFYFGEIYKNIKIINSQFAEGHDTVILSGHMPNVAYIGLELTRDDYRFKTGSFLVLDKDTEEQSWQFVGHEL